MRRFQLRRFWIDCMIATAFAFCVLFGLYGVTQLKAFNAFDPLGQALGDMEFTDIAFSQIREDPVLDTNIVVVNIGYLTRAEIGQQIRNLNYFKPKAIGLDIIFSCDGGLYDSINCPQFYDTLSNMIFAGAVQEATGRMVLAQKIWQTKELVRKRGDVAIYDSIEHTDAHLRIGAYEGFVNLETDAEHQEDLKVCRRFTPSLVVNGKKEIAYSVKLAWLFDSVKTKKFLSRNKASEIINYRGNIVDWHGASNYAGRYAVLDWDQALDTSMFVGDMIKDKIVIMGFLGRDLRDTSWDDKFFTPLNKVYAGKSRPDMYGPVVHANIVSMILNEDYVEELVEWQEYAIAIIICFLNVALFSLIHDRIPKWYDTLTIILQLTQIVLFTFAMMYVFSWADFKLNLTLTLAALALVGTCYEIYESIVKAFILRLQQGALFTKPNKDVLTP
ncbi:MAG TPA: CHASE2 domain-containing protein [Cyclobacteriaceae bacterium]|nr:CHASE2 domain-containing protein [Cyclobacteriaceae bacterium]